MTQEERIAAVLKEISDRAPKMLLKNVAKEVKATPTMEMVIEKVLKSKPKKISQEKLEKLQTLYDAGEFSKKRVVEDPKIAKQLDNYYSREIRKAVKEGRLPKNYKRT